ncbi:hypothetical protein AMS69_08960 [Haloarcula rubripromontorii]|uniref:Uncharacterized protein n=1 Tax=Haloarcula rubripromontorii TaxID=1705562 RepID=A0A0M9AMT2_9EURY|nr:hypothetical protein [Haloarcula rubripromontorii]KOX94035.1 hypothetical protein AMS69_08960 [Haloarcula rubripromontorii]
MRAVSVVLLPAIWVIPVTVGTVAIWDVSQQYRDKIDRGKQPAVVQERGETTLVGTMYAVNRGIMILDYRREN